METDAAADPQLSNASKADPSKAVASKRVYQVWKGSNKFFLSGRLIFGPDVNSLILTISLILVPVMMFCIFVARPLSDVFPHRSGDAIMVVAIVFTAYDLTLLLLTSARDPGIIPRNTHPPELEGYDSHNLPIGWGGGKSPRLRLPRTKDVIVNGVAVKVKYCDTCMLYRPPRCSHCSICNNCVERFDHHCPWVGQCIGRRNYPFFFMFVVSTMLLCIYVFALSTLYTKRTFDNSNPLWKTFGKCPAAVFLMGYTFIAVWFVGGLSFFHIYLLSTNQTTYENFRYHYDNRMNPYNFGISQNFKEIFCTAIPPSQNKFHAKVQHEFSVTAGSRDVSHSNNTFGKDIEMGGKLQWRSVVGSEDLKDLYGWSSDGTGMGFDNYEDSFTRALGFPFPYEGDCRVVTLARRSTCGAQSVSLDNTGGTYPLISPEGARVSEGSAPPSNR